MADNKKNEAEKSAQKEKKYNTQNLKPLNTRSKSEQREIQSKAGKKSGEVRAARKTFKEELLKQLEMQSKTGTSNNEAITQAILQRALRGDTKAFEIIRDTIGEKPTDKVDINTDTGINVNIKVVD